VQHKKSYSITGINEMTLNLSNEVLNRRVFKPAILEKHINNFLLGRTKSYLRKDKITLDIGAAVGMYSSFFAQHSKHVHSFEAVPPVYAQLVKIKGKYDNVTTYNKAVCDFVGESEFYVDDKRLSNSGFQNLVGGQKITVDTVTVDSMGFSNVGFMKVDVEGNELDVLNGSVNTLNENRPVCMIEIYEKFNKYPCSTTFEFFFDSDYDCYVNYRLNAPQYGKVPGLYKVESMDQALEEIKLPEITDGDFLFVPKEEK